MNVVKQTKTVVIPLHCSGYFPREETRYEYMLYIPFPYLERCYECGGINAIKLGKKGILPTKKVVTEYKYESSH